MTASHRASGATTRPGFGPARYEGDKRPPFAPGNEVGMATRAAPGNELRLTHGAYQPRRFEPLAEEMAAQLLDQASRDGSPIAYLADPTYRLAVFAWARIEARIQLVSEWLWDRGSELDDGGEPLGATKLLDRLEGRGEALRARLGLDPLSRARLGRDVVASSVDMARLMAEVGEGGSRGDA